MFDYWRVNHCAATTNSMFCWFNQHVLILDSSWSSSCFCWLMNHLHLNPPFSSTEKNSPGWWLTKSWKSRSLLIILQHKSNPILYFMIHHIILNYNVVYYPQVSPWSIPNLRLWRVLTSLQWCQGGVLLKPWSGIFAVGEICRDFSNKMVTYWAAS